LIIRQFPYARDNFSYLIVDQAQALAIDGGAVDSILAFLKQQKLTLNYATHTHQHGDHTCGTQELLDQTGAELLNFKGLTEEDILPWPARPEIKVWPSPGHTLDSVVFEIGSALITGDTLFNGTVGNCFSGDLKKFYHSIKRIMAYPDETIVYAGHDYVKESIAFARFLEPQNSHFDQYLANYTPHHVRSTLGDERRVNPFLRFNVPSMVQLMEEKGLPVTTEFERWISLMKLG
jgi:hydroxyacylglutathione hydrolase